MKKYNLKEKEFIKLLGEASDLELNFFSHFLQNKFFTKNSNSGLIILGQQKEALLFIRKGIFDNLTERKKELRSFLEILILSDRLRSNRLISLIPNLESMNNQMLFLKEEFDSPRSEKGSLILNKSGHYFAMLSLI